MQRWNDIQTRARALDPRVFDALVFVAFALAAIVESLLYPFDPATDRWIYPLGWVLTIAPAAWRRRFPLSALLASMVLADLVMLAAPDRSDALGGVLVAVLLLEFYNAALRTGGARLVAGLTLASGLLVVNVVLAGGLDTVGDALFVVGFVAAPVAAGRALRGRRLLVAALQERADRLEAERQERSSQAAEEERARIARELHDLVAHSVSQMTVQASAVRRVATADPAAAAAGLGAIEHDGRATLIEMRRMLGVLRGEAEGGALGPQPGLSGLDALVAQAREEGVDVGLAIEGERPPLPPGLDLTAYRIVEEVLADARARGGRGPLRVRVRYGEHALELIVSDGSPQGAALAFLTGEGEGFTGLRERVALYGGELRAAIREEGPAVRAVLPLEPVRA